MTHCSHVSCCKASFVCLQETHCVSEDEFSSWLADATRNGLNKLNYRVLSSPGTSRSSGVAILYQLDLHVVHSFKDQTGRLLCVEFECADFSVQICNVYAPNKKAAVSEFFESLHAVLDPDTPIVLCGDFNTVVDSKLDRFGCNPDSVWAYNWSTSLTNLMSTYDLHDVWRVRHPDEQSFTWKRPNGQQGSRLDMFWASSFLMSLVVRVDILPFFRSDHSYVYLELDPRSTVPRGQGLWKLNTNHLGDPDFAKLVSEFWASWRQIKPSFSSLSAWWDAGKARLRHHMRTFSRSKAASARGAIVSLENTLYHLNRRAAAGEDVQLLINDTKSELEAAHLARARGACLRSNVQWAEEGEASTAYFFRLEKKRARQRLISSIRNLAGVIVSSAQSIALAWIQFYVILFTSQPLDFGHQDFFLNALSLRLSEQERALCEGELSNAECKRALDGMASGKSPGLDGFPAEFYQRFWPVMGDDYVEVINFCFAQQSLSPSQRSGVITLLHKRGDRLDMKNWRPITLLCVDYKIAAKAIANRLLGVLECVIISDQTCGVPGRNCAENVRLLHDVVSHANQRGKGGAVISLDQEKAFDRVEWSYLARTLERMNFGPSFRAWVALFYTKIFSCVLVNGQQSSLFSVSRGVRQGCPLSPLLYVIVAETIACAIRQDPGIDGYPLPNNKRVKLCQYADDTSVIVCSIGTFEAVFSLFQRYELASGAKLNSTKSHGLLFSSWKHRTDFPVKLNWSSTSIVMLGSSLSNDGTEDWGSKIKTLSSPFPAWQTRKLSYHGRALIANVLVPRFFLVHPG